MSYTQRARRERLDHAAVGSTLMLRCTDDIISHDQMHRRRDLDRDLA